MSKRVVFTFDDYSLESLKIIQERAGFSSLGSALRDSIQIMEAVQKQFDEGYTELILRNKKSKQEKDLVIPSLHRGRRRETACHEHSRGQRERAAHFIHAGHGAGDPEEAQDPDAAGHETADL